MEVIKMEVAAPPPSFCRCHQFSNALQFGKGGTFSLTSKGVGPQRRAGAWRPQQPGRLGPSFALVPTGSPRLGFSCSWPAPGTMDQLLLTLFFLGVLEGPEAWAGSHSLRYFHTAWTRPELGEPRFYTVGYVDDVEFVRFDSDAPSPRTESRAPWMERVVQVDPEYWESNTRFMRGHARTFRGNLETLRGYYNQSQGGVHTLQFLLGCEMSPIGRLQRGFFQFAYDGRDYISLDTKTWTWTATGSQAEISKRKWEMKSEEKRVKAYLEEVCVQWLRKYLRMGKKDLTRTDLPTAQVTRHTAPNGEVTLRCRAQDFYPAEISLTWLRDGEEQLQDTEFIETRPGGDGTFQTWAALEVTPGQEERYICRVQHEGLSEPLTLIWKPPSSSTRIILGVSAGVLFTILVGVTVWMRNSDEKKRVYGQAVAKEKLMLRDQRLASLGHGKGEGKKAGLGSLPWGSPPFPSLGFS